MTFLNSVQKILNRIGDDEILKITVNRTPLSKVLKFLLNITSLGQLEKTHCIIFFWLYKQKTVLLLLRKMK